MPNSESSPVTGVVATVLRAWSDMDGVTIGRRERDGISNRIFSYSEDFDILWSALSTDAPCQESFFPTDIVIAWDQTPIDADYHPVPTDNYLTPVEWAVCARTHFPELRVTVLDTNPDAHASSKLYTYVRKFKGVELQWLTILDVRQLVNHPKDFLRELRISVEPSPTKDGALEDLKRLERLILTESRGDSDRHAISNMIGPMILLGDDHTWPHRHALPLKILFKSVGLLMDERVDRRETALDLRQEQNVLSDLLKGWTAINGPIEFLLIDDQANHGWSDWLKKVTNGTGPVVSLWKTKSSNDPGDALIANLQQQLSRRDGNPDLRFRLRLCNDTKSDNVSEILFLDLRLFSGEDERKEAEFIRRLIPMAREYTNGRPGLAWEGFDAQELSSIEEWVNDPDRNDSIYFAAITILPRLLALIDMSYPIVLFSSTGRKIVVRHLQAYKNIITLFEKPRYFGVATSDVQLQTLSNIHDAILQATKLLTVRDTAHKIRQIPRVTSSDTQWPYVEVYIDESGKSTGSAFCVGGMLIAYKSPEDAENIDRSVREAGLLWYGSRCLDKNKTQQNPEECAKKLAAILEDRPVVCFGLHRSPKYGALENRSELLNSESLDNVFLRLLHLELEILLREVIPIFRARCFSIHVATRARHFPFMGEEQKARLAAELLDRYNIETREDRKKKTLFYCSLQYDTIYLIASEVLSRCKEGRCGKPIKARGVRLAYQDDPVPRGFQHVHYFADLVAAAMRMNAFRVREIPTKPQLQMWKNWEPSGRSGMFVWEIDDDRFLHLLGASRDIDDGNRVAALVKALASGSPLSISGVTSFEQLVCARLADELGSITGDEFSRAVRLSGLLAFGGQPMYGLP